MTYRTEDEKMALRSEVRRLADAGLSVNMIMDKMGLSRRSVFVRLTPFQKERERLMMKPPKAPAPPSVKSTPVEVREAIIRDWELTEGEWSGLLIKKCSTKELLDKYGLSRTLIEKIIAEDRKKRRFS